MTDWLSFEGRVEPMVWGKTTYTILRLPPGIVAQLPLADTRRIDLEVNDRSLNAAVTTHHEGDGHYVWMGKTTLSQLAIDPGDWLEVRLRPASPDEVDLPEDVALALRGADLTADWEALTPGKRRGMLHQINTVKRAETRAKRIAKLMDALAG